MRAALLSALLAAPAALAWDGNDLWQASTRAQTPGGGGIWGTGGKQDHGITCAHCHVENRGAVDLSLTFTPPLGTLGTETSYSPGQTYRVTARMTGESLGRPYATCGQYLAHVNGFAIAFENAQGTRAGNYTTDTGLSSAACASTVQAASALTGSTITYGRCHAVASNSKEDQTQWTFNWIAPAAGAGTVTAFWGVVDGDCDMMSMRDAVKTGTLKLVQGTTARETSTPWRFASAGLLLLGLGWVVSRRATPL